MLRRSVLLSALSTALGACASGAPPAAADMPTPSTAANPPAPSQNFDVALYRAAAREPGNQFLSPFSVSAAFALLYPGARGQTASEISAAFGFESSPSAEAARMRALAQALHVETEAAECTLANAAWVERTMGLDPAYARALRAELGAAIEQVDFIANQSAALARINAWAAHETHNRIMQILSEPDPARRLVLTNAVYFKARWLRPFDEETTQDGDFLTDAGVKVRARLMRKTFSARYLETSGFQAAEFDYEGGAFALSVFLPKARNGVAGFEQTLTSAQLETWLRQLGAANFARLSVTLPKVRMNVGYSLKTSLQDIGVRTAFTNAADLSGVTRQTSLVVSEVIQKTFLAMDEAGTEAAAVTAIDIVATAAQLSPPPPPIEFKADHSFFVVLQHKPTGVRLFLGRVATTVE
jgi:serpin B